ncbi:MAG: hypothetical protein QXG39_08610 [Candidatus Aenigmatarchaeota archaeon]
MLTKEILKKLQDLKEKLDKKDDERFRDRIRYTISEDLRIFQRLKNRGFSEKKILKEVEKSREMPRKE